MRELRDLASARQTDRIIRSIDGFHQDDEGDWVAELSCLHNQHVRHRPPFLERSWVTSPEGRAERVGSPLECPLCDRLELPADLVVVRTAGPFDAETLPPALRRAHVVADRTWGLLHVLEGAVTFDIETTPPQRFEIDAGAGQPIAPGVHHRLQIGGPVRLEIEFLAKVP